MNPETAHDRIEREAAEQERDICKGCVQYLCRCPVGCTCESCLAAIREAMSLLAILSGEA